MSPSAITNHTTRNKLFSFRPGPKIHEVSLTAQHRYLQACLWTASHKTLAHRTRTLCKIRRSVKLQVSLREFFKMRLCISQTFRIHFVGSLTRLSRCSSRRKNICIRQLSICCHHQHSPGNGLEECVVVRPRAYSDQTCTCLPSRGVTFSSTERGSLCSVFYPGK